jgi:hypothetical protein
MMKISRSILAFALSLTAAACTKSAAPTCPGSFDELKGTGTQTCSCDGSMQQHGAVYGTDLYTTDSSICSAAKHAGIITDKGEVSVAAADGCQGYTGSAKNGVTTADWMSYPKSFYFTAHAKPSCSTK